MLFADLRTIGCVTSTGADTHYLLLLAVRPAQCLQLRLHGFIHDCLEDAIKQIQVADGLEIDPSLDRDTPSASRSGALGSW